MLSFCLQYANFSDGICIGTDMIKPKTVKQCRDVLLLMRNSRETLILIYRPTCYLPFSKDFYQILVWELGECVEPS